MEESDNEDEEILDQDDSEETLSHNSDNDDFNDDE